MNLQPVGVPGKAKARPEDPQPDGPV